MRRGARGSSTHQRPHKDPLMHGRPNEVSDDSRSNDEEEDLHHAPCAALASRFQRLTEARELASRAVMLKTREHMCCDRTGMLDADLPTWLP